MNTKLNYWLTITIMSAAILLIAAKPAASSAQDIKIITPGEAKNMTGMTYGEWSAAWWQYVLSMPVSDPNNPLLDLTGAGCKAAQPNGSPVFFLVGSWGSGEVIRDECIVPAGKVLFFPLVNAFNAHSSGDGLDTPELLRDNMLTWFSPEEFYVSINGVEVQSFSACAGGDPACTSTAFSLRLTGNNLFTGSPARIGRKGAPWLSAGIYAPAVADGYYLMLAPLSPGVHTISFGGYSCQEKNDSCKQDITYNLIVK